MKGPIVSLLLVGLSQAARVYLSPSPPVFSVLSTSQAGAVLSRHLGLDYYEPLAEDSEQFIELGSQEPFVGQGSGSALLLTVPEKDAADVIPSALKESFSLPSDVSMNSIPSLISAYLKRARHAYSHIFSQPTLPEGAPRIIDIFSVPSSASQTFLSEMTTLVDFLESEVSTDKFAALEFTGLSELAEEHGRDSEQYRLASETIQSFLSSALEKRDLKLAVVTVPIPSAQLKRQSQPPQSPLPPPIVHPAEPIDATCHATVEACENSTYVCSGHGQCVQASKAGRTCFMCACSATKNSHGQTENWAGTSCERKDVSGPFVLITGTVVALIILIGGSVALLTGIGEQELPSTLTGGIIPTGRKD